MNTKDPKLTVLPKQKKTPPAQTTPVLPKKAPQMEIMEEPSIQINPQIIVNAIKCIDASATRGAFQGGEMTTVGQTRDALYSTIAHLIETETPPQN